MMLSGQLSSSKKSQYDGEKEELTKADMNSFLRMSKLLSDVSNHLRLWDTVEAWFSCQLQPLVVTAPLHSPRIKQLSMKPMILARIGRAERSTIHVDVNLRSLPPRNFSDQKSDLGQKIQPRLL